MMAKAGSRTTLDYAMKAKKLGIAIPRSTANCVDHQVRGIADIGHGAAVKPPHGCIAVNALA
jgi:hypothetical protein